MTTETATPNQADASTAFLRAARAGQIERILALLNQDVDINVSNANGLNAIHLASKDGHVAVVTELLRRGADIDAATKKGNTALHIASLAGQEAVVKLLVQNGAQVNIQSQNGFTPLYMAAQENHDGVVKFLLANGANQSLATEDGFTPLAVAMQQGHERVVAVLLESDTRGRVRLPALHIAAKKDDVKAANLLLENEHNPDVTSKSGFTPLHITAHYGNEAVARLLLAKGADVNCPAKHNICPLHVAAKWGKDKMVALLCDNGANVEARTRDGLTPLHCAARSGHERVVEALLERGSPITSKSKNGLAPLHMAAQGDHAEATRVLLARRAPVDDVTVDYLTALHVAAHCGHAKAAKLLLDKNADANARALNGFTPLHIACKKNRIKVVELLLKHGASISATTESGLTPLHVAAFMGCMNIVIYLLQHEASPDVPTVRGETPLHLAARANQTDIIRILLRNGAAVEAKARERQTPLHIASRLGNVDIAVLLLQHGADVRAATADHYNALHIAAKQHNHDVAAALIEHGAPLTATTKKGFTPLHLAAKYGNLKVANLLLAHGASPDQAGKNGVTPLHVAAQYEQQAVASALLEKGADAKAVAKNGHTPLHIAARKNQMETAATLLEYGALTNAESKAGFTPLHLAAQQGHTEMCSLLLEHGGDVNQQARNGLSALHLAAQEDRVPVAQQLIKSGAKVDICTKGGYTPLHVASHFGQTATARCLLESGAEVRAPTAHRYTALHHAAQQGHVNIVNLLLEHKADANDVTTNGQTPLDIASKLGYVTVVETLKGVSEPSAGGGAHDKYKVVAPETMHETFMSDSEEEGGEDTLLADQPYRYLTADDMKSLGDDSLPIDVTRDERADSAIGHKNIMEMSQGSMNGVAYGSGAEETVVKSVSRYDAQAQEGYCYNVDPTMPNFLVSFLVDAKGGAMRGCRGGGVRVIVPPLSAQQPTRITCRYLKPSRINHMPPLMEGEALASRVLEMGPVSAKFLGPVILEVPHYASLRGKEREIVILRSDNGTSWREHNTEATDDVLQDILHETLEIEENGDEPANGTQNNRITRILTHDFPQYFAVISRIRQEVHAIGPEGGMVSSSVVPQVQAVFPQGALTKKIKVGLQAQIIDSELTAKLLGRGVAVSPVVTVEPRRRKFHKAITLSMPAPVPHTQGMTNQYSTASAPTLRLLCSISGVFRKRSLEGGTNRAHWEDVTDNTPLTFVNDCVSFTTTVSARYWLIDCRHVEDATKMATELYREAIHVPFMARFVVYAKRTEQHQAQLRMFCVTDDREDKTLERMERFTQVAKSRDVEVHEGKPSHLEFAGNLVPIAKSGEQLCVPFRAFRENRLSLPAMVKSLHADPVARCQFMREPKVAKGEPSPAPICVLNILVPEETTEVTAERAATPVISSLAEDQDLVWRQRLSDPRLLDICNLLGKDWVALAYELGVSVATVNQIQNKRIGAAEQAQLMLKLWRTQSGTKAQDNSLELALCRIGRDDIIAPQSDVTTERRIQRNIYQERQASEEIDSYKADDDNKLKERTHDDNQTSDRVRTQSEIQEQEEAKYSPEEKSIADTTERDRTPSPSEESEEDEGVKRSVAERKVQITRKLSSSKIPASKQKKEIREEILEIKTQIKPVTHETVKLERTRSKTSPDSVEEEKEIEIVKEEPKPIEKPKEQAIKRIDTSSPAKPTPKHLQKHMRNESMHRFSSGDFSDIKITPRKSIPTDTITATKQFIEAETKTKENISQKEIVTSKVEEKFDDDDKSPDIIDDEKDIAEAPLRTKISSFESKMVKEQNGDISKTSVKLTKEALKKHTLDHEQDNEYTQEFVREQSKTLIETEKITHEIETHTETVKSVKETIQQFDTRVKEDKTKSFAKPMRTDSTIVQVSSEEDSEFLKKSTDSETETESQTTVKVDKGLRKEAKELKKDTKDMEKYTIVEEKTDQLRRKISEEDLVVTQEDTDLLPTDDRFTQKKMAPQLSVASAKSEVSKTHTKTDSDGSDLQEFTSWKISQESPVPSQTIDKADSLADLQQSTERDVSFISSHTESKIYSKDSKQRSDSLDEASQFSDLEDQQVLGTPSPAHRPTTLDRTEEETIGIVPVKIQEVREQTSEFLAYESEYSAQIHAPVLELGSVEKVSPKESPVISAKARQFIETVPEDDSVQECFFSKRIYSDSLEDSEHTDSRRQSEGDSLKSDQSDVKAKMSSSDMDERAEYEEAVDSGSGFGDEKFEESIGFTSMKLDPVVAEDKDSDSDKIEDPIFKKMTSKRHSRTDSVSITKLSDLDDTEGDKPKHQFQMFVTEAEETAASFDKDDSDKISSESSREIEISDRKSSEVSDKISSEDAVTDKKTSSEEEAKEAVEERKAQMSDLRGSMNDLMKIDSQMQVLKDDIAEKVTSPVDPTKRQSVASSGSITELRLDEKRLSDAYSLTESRDYTFEESEDSFGAHIVEASKEVAKVEKVKVVTERVVETVKPCRLPHGDSLDDVEAFPEDHVMEHLHKLPHIEEIVAQSSIDLKDTAELQFDDKIRQQKQESFISEATISTSVSADTPEIHTKEVITTYAYSKTEHPFSVIDTSKIKKVEKSVDEYVEKSFVTSDFSDKQHASSTVCTKEAEQDLKSLDQSEDIIKSVHKEKPCTVKDAKKDKKDSDVEKPLSKDLDLKLSMTSEITKEQLKEVIDDILEEGTKVAIARSPVVEKDIKSVTRDMIQAEKTVGGSIYAKKEDIKEKTEITKDIIKQVSDEHKEVVETKISPQEQTKVPHKTVPDIKQIAENIEIVIKQASEEQLTDDIMMGRDELAERVSVDSIIEQAVNTVEEYLDQDSLRKSREIEKRDIKHHILHKSLSRDSGEGVMIPKKKHPRTYSVQSSPDDVEEQIYTDSESDIDKAKVLEIIEPRSEFDAKLPSSSFDPRKLRTDSLDDADDLFPEKEAEYVVVDHDVFMQLQSESSRPHSQSEADAQKPCAVITGESSVSIFRPDDKTPMETLSKKSHIVEKIINGDVFSTSTTESSVTTVISTLTKSSDDDQKSVLDATSADYSKISGAELAKDASKASIEVREEQHLEEKDEMSKISVDLTKDSSKSSIDSKDTSRDFATNELSKDSTVDLSKDFSKMSVESVKDASRSIDEKTFSEDHSSMDLSKTLASDHDTSEASIASKELSKFVDDERSISKIVEVSSKTCQESPSTGEEQLSSFERISSKSRGDILDEPDDSSAHRELKMKSTESEKKSSIVDDSFIEKELLTKGEKITTIKEEEIIKDYEEKPIDTFQKAINDQSIEKLSRDSEINKIEIETSVFVKKTTDNTTVDKKTTLASGEDKKATMAAGRSESSSSEEDRDKILSDMKDLNRLDRRCSDLLEGISQGGALIRIDSSHVTHHDLSLKFSKTPPPSPVDLISRDKANAEEGVAEKHTGLQPKGSDSSFLDASRQSPRASSAGDSLYSETEAHHSEILSDASKALSAAATPKSPSRHLADNLSFINVSQPTITTGAMELVDRTIEKSIDVIGQIQQEQHAARMEELSKTESSVTTKTETTSSTLSVSKVFDDFKSSELKFESIDPQAMMADLVAKVAVNEFSTVLTHTETETHKISGQEYFVETRHVSSSDDDSLVIKTETKHELRGQEHEVKEKTTIKKDGDQTETSQKKTEKSQETTDKRADVETKAVCKTTDDTEMVLVHREFTEQGLYSGRQTKSEEKMTAIKDDSVKKTSEVKYSERDLSHEQWGKEYFTESSELGNIEEDDDRSRAKEAFVESTLKIIEKDETVSSQELSEKGKIVSAKTEHFKEESIHESKGHHEHDDISSDISHEMSFKSDTAEKPDSSEMSPKSKSKSFKKDDEVYEIDFIKEIKISTSPVQRNYSRSGSQDTQSESEGPDLPHDDKIKDSPVKTEKRKSPVKVSHEEIQDQLWEVSVQKADSFEIAEDIPKFMKPTVVQMKCSLTKSSENDNTLIDEKTVKEIIVETSKLVRTDFSPITASDDMSTSKDIMIKSGESIDTEYMVKSLESHEGEALQKSMDSTVSAETLHPSDFSTEADSAFLTGTDHKKEEVKLIKEKSLEDICSSGYDTDLSSAEFHGTKLDTERVDVDMRSAQPLTDLSVLEKTIDEVKQSLEAAQVEIISEKSDGSSKYKQSPSEFEFKLISPDKPESIAEESHEEIFEIPKPASVKKVDIQKSESISPKASSHEETTSDEERDTIQEKERSPGPPDTSELSCKSDSGPHSILETESIISERDESSKGSPEIKLRVSKHLKTKVGVADRRSGSDIEGWSSSGDSHYQSFEHTDSPHSRPLSSDVENMMTTDRTADFETALTSGDGTTKSLRTSKDYYTAASSLTSRDSMRSLDSEGSSHLASIDISDASETLVPSANELKEELMETGTFADQFMQDGDFPKDKTKKVKKEDRISDDEASFDEEEKGMLDEEPVGKMKRSHEMRFQPKEMIPEYFPLESIAGSIDIEVEPITVEDKDIETIVSTSDIRQDVSRVAKFEGFASEIEPVKQADEAKHTHKNVPSSDLQKLLEATTADYRADKVLFATVTMTDVISTKIEPPQPADDTQCDITHTKSLSSTDTMVEVISFQHESTKPIELAMQDYNTEKVSSTIVKIEPIPTKIKQSKLEEEARLEVVSSQEPVLSAITAIESGSNNIEPSKPVEEIFSKVAVKGAEVIPFKITQKPESKREFVDFESEIIAFGSKEYDEITKSSSKTTTKEKIKQEETKEKEESGTLEPYPLDSQQSSSSSLKVHENEYLSTPHTPLSMPSQSSESTDNGKEYVLDDLYEISDAHDLRSERSELVITTEEKTLYEPLGHQKDQDSPTSDEFEIVDKPSEIDDFVVIEEVAKEASETDEEGKSLQIKQQKFVIKHDTEVEEYLSKASKKQDSEYSTSGSLSDEEMLQYELEQKKLKAQELAEAEAGKKWMQTQFEGDPRYEYERVPLEDIKEEEMTDFDASRIGSLSSQKESVGSFGSTRNSYGSLSESEMMSRRRFMVKGDQDDVSISSLQEFENLEQALMDQYQQHSSSSQDSLNGSLPRRYQLSRSGDDMSVSSLKEFEGLESACMEALKVEILAKQKEALLLSQDPKIVSGGFLEHEKRSYSGSSESSPPQKSGSPGQKSSSPSLKSGSPSQKSGSPGQRYGSPSQKALTDSAAIRKLIDQQMALDPQLKEIKEVIIASTSSVPTIVTAKKFDDRGQFFTTTESIETSTKPIEISEDCRKSSAYSCILQKDNLAESLPGDCEEMMKILDQEAAAAEQAKTTICRTVTDGGVIEVVRTTKVIQQKFVDGKKVSETITTSESGMDIPGAKSIEYDSGSVRSFELDVMKSLSSEVSSSATSQQSDIDSIITMIEKPFSMSDSTSSNITVVTKTRHSMSLDKPDELDLTRSSDSMIRELSPASGRSGSHTITSVSGKHFTDPASGSWSGQDEDMSSSGSFSRGARADMMLGSTDSLEATSSNATRATYNYEVDTPMTGSLTSGGSNTMVSSLDTLDPVTTMHVEGLDHVPTSEHYSHDYDVQEPDSDTERLELDGRVPRAKERTIMFDSTDTLSAVSGDGSVREAAVEGPALTFFIGDTPIVKGSESGDGGARETQLSGSCPASLPPLPTQQSPPIPAQRRSLTMIGKSPPTSMDETKK